MVDLQTARTNVTQARQVLTSQKAKVSEAESKVAESRAGIPDIRSQTALRQTYTGLAGREQRRKIAGAERTLTAQEEEIAGYKVKLGEYEKEIQTAEQQISAAEKEAAEWETAKALAGTEYGLYSAQNNPSLREKILAIEGGQKAQEAQIRYEKAIDSGTYGESFNKFLETATPQQIRDLEKAGILTYKTVEVPSIEDLRYKSAIQFGDGGLQSVRVLNREPTIFSMNAKELYAKNIKESVGEDKGIFKAIGTVQGVIEGTGEIVEAKLTNMGGIFSREVKIGGERLVNYGSGLIQTPSLITKPIYSKEVSATQAVEETYFKIKTPEQINKITFTPYKFTEQVGTAMAEYSPLARAIGGTVKAAPYFIPYVGEGLLLASGTRNVVKGETTGEKLIGATEIVGGLVGLRLRTMKTALTPPRELTADTVITYGKKMKTRNIPRLKEYKIGQEFGEKAGLKDISVSKGGTQTVISPIRPKVRTAIRGKDWVQVQTSVGGKTSGEIITSKRNFLGVKEDYYIKYRVNAGKTEYEVSKVIEPSIGIQGGTKLGRSGLVKVEDIQVAEENILGYGEALKKSGTKVDTKITLKKSQEISGEIIPKKSVVRTRVEDKILEQKLIKTQKSPIEIKEDLGLKTLETKRRVTIVRPAEQNILLNKKYYPKEDTLGLRIAQKRLVPKFSKSQPPDVVELKGVSLRPESRSTLSVEGITPRYKDIVQIERKSVGQFTLYQPSAAEKLAERIKSSQLVQSKKGQLGLMQIKELGELKVLKDIQNVQVRRVVSPRLEQFEFNLVVPQQINLVKGKLEVGVISLLKSAQEKKIEQKMSVDQIQLMDLAVINKEKLKLNQRQIVETKTALDTVSKLRTETLTETNIDTTLKPRIETPKPKTPRTPKKPKKFIFTLPQESESKSRIREIGGRLFEAIKVSKGQEVSLGTERTPYLAGQKLKKSLKQSLSASGFVQEVGGKRLKFTELAPLLGGEFTQGKYDITRIVQKRGTRLGTSQETFKIQKAKKIKKGGWL